jgi:hypothetical protein
MTIPNMQRTPTRTSPDPFSQRYLIGAPLRWSEKSIQAMKDKSPFCMKEAPGGGIHIELQYEKDGGELKPTLLTPEQLLAMLLVNLK